MKVSGLFTPCKEIVSQAMAGVVAGACGETSNSYGVFSSIRCTKRPLKNNSTFLNTNEAQLERRGGKSSYENKMGKLPDRLVELCSAANVYLTRNHILRQRNERFAS